MRSICARNHRSKTVTAILAICIVLPLVFVLLPQHAGAQTAGYRWPVEGQVIKGFARPTGSYGEGGHQGLDIAAPGGAEVRSAAAGTVAWVGEVPRGRFVTLAHAGGVRTTYLDLENIVVQQGSEVAAGQPLGTLGGTRDDSSGASHLHFDAYIRGSPVDPRVLFDGLGTSSFIRLCPAQRADTAVTGGTVDRGGRPGLWSQVAHGVASGFKSLGGGVAAAARWVGRTVASAWSDYVYKALCAVGRACKWVWNNKWVQAVVAAVVAALAILAVLVVALVAGVISGLVLVVAGLVAGLACLVAALVYAAYHPEGFSFAGCFLTSLSAGAMAASAVVSFGMLGSAFTAGWAEVGLLGTAKAALFGGVWSASFEFGYNYLLTGQLSWSKMLIAFGIGALSAAVARVAIAGIKSGSRVFQAISFVCTESRASLVQLGGELSVMVREGAVTLQGVIVVLKQLSITLGTRLAYMGVSGSLGTGLNALTCIFTGKPITLSGSLATFFTGAAMGAISLSFGGEGIGGLLEKLSFFRQGVGRVLKKLAVKLVGKAIHKGINFTFKKAFSKALGEEVPQ